MSAQSLIFEYWSDALARTVVHLALKASLQFTSEKMSGRKASKGSKKPLCAWTKDKKFDNKKEEEMEEEKPSSTTEFLPPRKCRKTPDKKKEETKGEIAGESKKEEKEAEKAGESKKEEKEAEKQVKDDKEEGVIKGATGGATGGAKRGGKRIRPTPIKDISPWTDLETLNAVNARCRMRNTGVDPIFQEVQQNPTSSVEDFPDFVEDMGKSLQNVEASRSTEFPPPRKCRKTPEKKKEETKGKMKGQAKKEDSEEQVKFDDNIKEEGVIKGATGGAKRGGKRIRPTPITEFAITKDLTIIEPGATKLRSKPIYHPEQENAATSTEDIPDSVEDMGKDLQKIEVKDPVASGGISGRTRQSGCRKQEAFRTTRKRTQQQDEGSDPEEGPSGLTLRSGVFTTCPSKNSIIDKLAGEKKKEWEGIDDDEETEEVDLYAFVDSEEEREKAKEQEKKRLRGKSVIKENEKKQDKDTTKKDNEEDTKNEKRIEKNETTEQDEDSEDESEYYDAEEDNEIAKEEEVMKNSKLTQKRKKTLRARSLNPRQAKAKKENAKKSPPKK
ncbi:hypothetical protein CDAR_165791 [Caerostris darwini]|uniref:Uncharacterized protein n=1 Tax=Caerostris darwini TaxID=1538125 RepID=A0AAV4RW38_9ARAC|nr:hypothetical protein CDAR_165791 [Caerostris darwini]